MNKFFNGIKFYKREDNGYWYSTSLIGGKKVYMHKYVWEYYNYKIPNGYDIHHKDLNKDNNDISNLILLEASEHKSLHAKLNLKNAEYKKSLLEHLNSIRDKSKEWHKSDAGRAWHKEHFEKCKDKMFQKAEYTCMNCGKKFTTTKGKNFFCSNKCKSAYRRKSGIDNEVRICAVCGAEFTINKYSKTKTCCRSCASKLALYG